MTMILFRAFFLCVHGAMSLFCRNLIRIFSCVDVWKWKKEPEKTRSLLFRLFSSLMTKVAYKISLRFGYVMMITITTSAFNSSFKVVVFISLDKNGFSPRQLWVKEDRKIDWLDRFSRCWLHLSWSLIVFLDASSFDERAPTKCATLHGTRSEIIHLRGSAMMQIENY